jgi:hypothetical protein
MLSADLLAFDTPVSKKDRFAGIKAGVYPPLLIHSKPNRCKYAIYLLNRFKRSKLSALQ